MADDILKNIPLPADLPENWTSDQIVAPTGAEAGLDEQYGYNYLMQQVNNAQKALKALAAQREEDLARIKFWASNDPTSPASFIGGTWEQIKDSFILAAGDTYAAGSTGGEAAHTLTNNEMPAHNHAMAFTGGTGWDKETVNEGFLFTVGSWVEYHNESEIVEKVSFAQVNIGNAGKSSPHNNMPPYITMYIWRRVA